MQDQKRSFEHYQNYFSVRLSCFAEAREAADYLNARGYKAYRDECTLWYDKFAPQDVLEAAIEQYNKSF